MSLMQVELNVFSYLQYLLLFAIQNFSVPK